MYLRDRGYRCFCPVVDGAVPESALPKEAAHEMAGGAGAAGAYPSLLHHDIEAVKEIMLPGTRRSSGRSTGEGAEGAQWVLGSALEPQAGKPSCIDAGVRYRGGVFRGVVWTVLVAL